MLPKITRDSCRSATTGPFDAGLPPPQRLPSLRSRPGSEESTSGSTKPASGDTRPASLQSFFSCRLVRSPDAKTSRKLSSTLSMHTRASIKAPGPQDRHAAPCYHHRAPCSHSSSICRIPSVRNSHPTRILTSFSPRRCHSGQGAPHEGPAVPRCCQARGSGASPQRHGLG